jgi:hypothetical protein
VAVGRPDPDAGPGRDLTDRGVDAGGDEHHSGGWLRRRARSSTRLGGYLRACVVLVLAEGNRERKRSAERGPGGSRRCPVVRSLRELHEGCIRGRRQVDGTCYPVVCLSIPGSSGSAGWSVRSHCRRRGVRRPRCFYLQVWEHSGPCGGLYVAVRAIGGPEALAHVHIDDMHRAGLS